MRISVYSGFYASVVQYILDFLTCHDAYYNYIFINLTLDFYIHINVVYFFISCRYYSYDKKVLIYNSYDYVFP